MGDINSTLVCRTLFQNKASHATQSANKLCSPQSNFSLDLDESENPLRKTLGEWRAALPLFGPTAYTLELYAAVNCEAMGTKFVIYFVEGKSVSN